MIHIENDMHNTLPSTLHSIKESLLPYLQHGLISSEENVVFHNISILNKAPVLCTFYLLWDVEQNNAWFMIDRMP